VKSPIEIPHPDSWNHIENLSRTNQIPTKIGQIREMLELGNETSDLLAWCLGENQTVSSAHAWEVFSGGSTAMAPMSIYLEALALPSTSFTPASGTWTEVDLSERGCASLTDANGNLLLTLSIS
jgi:hypothetical protein